MEAYSFEEEGEEAVNSPHAYDGMFSRCFSCEGNGKLHILRE